MASPLIAAAASPGVTAAASPVGAVVTGLTGRGLATVEGGTTVAGTVG